MNIQIDCEQRTPAPKRTGPLTSAAGGPSSVASIVKAIGTSTSRDEGAGYWQNTAIFIFEFGSILTFIEKNFGSRRPLVSACDATGRPEGLPHTTRYDEHVIMALIAVSGHPGCRFEEVARLTAQRLRFELLTPVRVRTLTEEEFGAGIPDKAYAGLVTSVLARLATEHHLVYCGMGGELQSRHFPGALRVHVVAPENVRVGNLMLDHRLERAAARRLLQELEAAERATRKARFGKSKATADLFDLVLSAESLSTEQMAELIETAAHSMALTDRGYLSPAAEAQLQFQMRLSLARHGIAPPDPVTLRKKPFAHASEEMFANLLDFYRIAWDYEPRSFPVQWDRDGNVHEAFTPDFYLPEFDLYVELTTMKQSLVTRKNRKVRLLRELYPHLNIQVFYQKDFENLIFKYGLAERPVHI